FARPCDRDRKRFNVGPQFTNARDTTIDSLSPSSFCSALATADRKIFSTTFDAWRGKFLSSAKAIGTCCPRIKSTTGRAFLGEIRTNLRTACASAITVTSNRVWQEHTPALT